MTLAVRLFIQILSVISADDLFEASHLTRSFCQGKLSRGHVKFDVLLMTVDDLIAYFRFFKPTQLCLFDEISMFIMKLAMLRFMSSLIYIICKICVCLSATFHRYKKKN